LRTARICFGAGKPIETMLDVEGRSIAEVSAFANDAKGDVKDH
jgi:hypothetical protein